MDNTINEVLALVTVSAIGITIFGGFLYATLKSTGIKHVQ